MTDPYPRPDPDGDRASVVRRWLKVAAVAVGLVVLLFVVFGLVSGGEHGPSRHQGPDGTGATSHTPPAGMHGDR